jgi:sporulation protein YlmC with PRC-barrel domain
MATCALPSSQKGGSMKRASILAATTAIGVLAALQPALGQSPGAPASSPAAASTPAPTTLDARRLIGRPVHNPQGESVGDVNAVMITRDGAVAAVIVGVGGFLGIGERDVAIRWQDVQVSSDGGDVRTTLSKDDVRALPEYRFSDDQRRGTVFAQNAGTQNAGRDAPVPNADAASPRPSPPPAQAPQARPPQPQAVARAAPETAPRTVGPTPDSLSANAIIGASVRDPRNESIGRVYDIIMDAHGTPQTIVISIGGVLGIGGRRAAVPLSDVRIMRDGDSVFLATGLTTDELQRLPEYRPQ